MVNVLETRSRLFLIVVSLPSIQPRSLAGRRSRSIKSHESGARRFSGRRGCPQRLKPKLLWMAFVIFPSTLVVPLMTYECSASAKLVHEARSHPQNQSDWTILNHQKVLLGSSITLQDIQEVSRCQPWIFVSAWLRLLAFIASSAKELVEPMEKLVKMLGEQGDWMLWDI